MAPDLHELHSRWTATQSSTRVKQIRSQTVIRLNFEIGDRDRRLGLYKWCYGWLEFAGVENDGLENDGVEQEQTYTAHDEKL